MSNIKSNTRTYHIWENMKQRCNNPKANGYSYYGGRGIALCKRWHSFDNFLADMGEVPMGDYSIDRIYTNGNYTPENCRWSDRRAQSINTRKRKDNTSGETGVSYRKNTDRWISKVCNPKGSPTRFSQKSFMTKEEAIEYNKVARELVYGVSA